MVKCTAPFRWTLNNLRLHLGYTTLELIVVLAVIGMLTVIGLFGVGTFNKTQFVINSQTEFFASLRATQNQVRNGASGASVKSVYLGSASTYTLSDGTVVTLPNGVTLSPVGSYICFANDNLSAFSATNPCGSSCTSGSNGFICSSGTLSAPASGYKVTFTNGSASRAVTVYGTGMNITRIDTQ